MRARNIFQDLDRNANFDASPTTPRSLGERVRAFVTVRYQAVFLFRLAQTIGRFAPPVADLIKAWNQVVTSADISWRAEIGPGLVLFHPSGVVVGPDVRIGKNCTLQQGVTIGTSWGSSSGSPVLGNEVMIGAGTRVIGGIILDDRTVAGANAVVTKSSPDSDMVAVGVPAKWRENRKKV